MNRLRIWYSKNKKEILISIAVILGIFFIIKIVNFQYKKENDNILNYQEENNTDDSYSDIKLNDDNSTVTGKKLSDSQKIKIDTINKFVEYCNKEDLENAYNLISDDCKNEYYPDLENFKEGYYNDIFNGNKKSVNVENWVNNIYKVNYTEDYLSTGKYSSDNNIQDYITIVDQNDEHKLNINNYVGKYGINKTNEDEETGIKIEVEESNVFMEYETYKIKVTNNSDNIIKLDDGVDTKAMYIQDKNGKNFSAYTHELSDEQLTVRARQSKEIEIKYYSKYNSDKVINKIVFSRVILDNELYKEYELNNNINLYKDYCSLEIEI